MIKLESTHQKENEMPITQCPYCKLNTAGTHEWNCPNHPRNKTEGNKAQSPVPQPTVNVYGQPTLIIRGSKVEDTEKGDEKLKEWNMAYGWVCPLCGRVYAPWVQSCLYCVPTELSDKTKGVEY